MQTFLNLGRHTSRDFNLNFVAQEDKTFVMDNHLAALWCWLQKIDTSRQYNLFHIDRHIDFDTVEMTDLIREILNKNIDIKNLAIRELAKQTFRLSDERVEKFFRWNNYFAVFNKLFPDVLTDKKYFAIHTDSADLIFDIIKKEPHELPGDRAT